MRAPTIPWLVAALLGAGAACPPATSQRGADDGGVDVDGGADGPIVDGVVVDGVVVDGGVVEVPSLSARVVAHRDRLLGTLVEGQDRCAAWSGLDEVQRGVFLTVTDLLGRRTALRAGDDDDDGDMALDHVTRLWAINGAEPSGCLRCCGGGEFNRLYFSADDVLARALRADDGGLPAWQGSTDLAGPHDPFTRSLETIAGQPRGQLHLWSSDAQAAALDRPGVVGVVDPRVVEIDIDYNVIHESNPECSYSGASGRARYEALWSNEDVVGGAGFDYAPGGC